VPAFSNVTAADDPPVSGPLSKADGPLTEVKVCVAPSRFVTVTVEPVETCNAPGENAKLLMAIAAATGAGGGADDVLGAGAGVVGGRVAGGFVVGCLVVGGLMVGCFGVGFGVEVGLGFALFVGEGLGGGNCEYDGFGCCDGCGCGFGSAATDLAVAVVAAGWEAS
jgi:hypothetical protein